ncbi:MAG: replication initiator protein A [Clostridia bacterium]|nr:replication initiator protein A [Clostridia bacterium]
MQSSFERENFCRVKAKICRNTRLFQEFSTQTGRKGSVQNLIDYRFKKYKIPKFLFGDEYRNILSTDAKLLYGLLLDRSHLSAKNGWVARDGRVFLYFTVAEAAEKLSFGKDKILSLFREIEKAGLIERRRLGLGKPSVIYFQKHSGKTDFSKSENTDSEGREIRIQQVGKSECNNNEYSNNDFNNNNPSICGEGYDEIRMRVEEQVDYDYLCSVRDKIAVDEIITVICDTLYGKSEKIRIGGELMSRRVVEARFAKLDADYVCYVIDSLEKNTASVRNIKSYMLTALYNAPATCDHYYRALVNNDLYGKADFNA